MLLFVQPLSVNSVINCLALSPLHSDRFLIEILSSLLNGAMLTGSVRRIIFTICVIFASGLKDEKLIKSKPTQKLKHANSILEYFEYYCQMSSKSILTILSYTVSKFARFSETQCSSSSGACRRRSRCRHSVRVINRSAFT